MFGHVGCLEHVPASVQCRGLYNGVKGAVTGRRKDGVLVLSMVWVPFKRSG